MATDSFIPLNILLVTVSDSRTLATDTSGQWLAASCVEAGHKILDRIVVKDDRYQLRALVSQHIAASETQVIITSGGTGFTGRDTTPEALIPLFDKTIEGFGELFRAISWEEIGSSTIQSRAIAGLANGTLIFCLPGSTGACKTGWSKIIAPQLDSRHRPCNFAAVMPRFFES